MPLKTELEKYVSARGIGDGSHETAIKGLKIVKFGRESPICSLSRRPALDVTVQGKGEISFDAGTAYCGEMQSLILGLHRTAFGQIIDATPEHPYLGLTIDLDPALLRSVMKRLDPPPIPTPDSAEASFIDNVTQPLADCLTRLVRLLSTPRAIPVLHRLILNELAYWLLTGPSGGEVCKIAMPFAPTQRISNALQLLHKDLADDIQVPELATAAGMSESAFYQSFKLLTSMTPLQYRKQLRLIAARRLLEEGEDNVTGAAYRVGYQSPSQFSREYKRMFGVPPKQAHRSGAADQALGE
jgi:AraC-like DNA-binding protein